MRLHMYPPSPSGAQPPTRLALIVTFLMLLLTTALAGALTWRRQEVSLDQRVFLPNWSITFRPPADWPSRRVGETADQSVIVFSEPGGGKHGHALVVRRLAVGGVDSPAQFALGLYGRLLRRQAGPGATFRVMQAAPQAIPFGPLPGVRIDDPDLGLVVHVGFDGSTAYSIELTSPSPLTRKDSQLFQRVVGSVEYSQT